VNARLLSVFGRFCFGKIRAMPKVEITVAFASVLKKHRAAKGMSQETLAEKANIHPTHVGLLERSLRNPSLKVIKAIADALGLPLAQMIAEAEQLCGKGKRP
jgi:transcriptional regulator with XRE-family HTH domain